MKKVWSFLLAICLLLSGMPAMGKVEAASSVAMNVKKQTLEKGEQFQLAVTGTTDSVKWSTSNKKVATVSKTGLVKAKKKGKATITAKVGSKKLTCKITVKNKKVALNAKSKTIIKGNKYYLKLSNNTKKVKWTSSNKKVATVNKKGVVTAKKKGTAIIKAKVGKKTYKCKITVKNKHKDKMTYASGVKKDELKDVKDYTITAGDNYFTVDLSAYSSVLSGLKAGDVFVLPASSRYPQGYAGKVESITDGKVKAIAPCMEELLSDYDVSGEVNI